VAVRDAKREDLYALQQEGRDDPLGWNTERSGTEILHKGCGGRVAYVPGQTLSLDRYVCNGVTKTFGKCGWSWRCDVVHVWTDPAIAADLQVKDREDVRVYKLELVEGRKGDHDGVTYYHTRLASATETQTYYQGESDPWKLR